jgi:hydroxyethylthiazole kinase-like uncharacterized protein yjeF
MIFYGRIYHLNMNQLNNFQWINHLRRQPDAYKGDAGRMVVIGGSANMLGAVVLAGSAALYTGAGWTHLWFLDQSAPSLISTHPELMVRPRLEETTDPDSIAHLLTQLKADCIAIGPGLGQTDHAFIWLKGVLDWVAHHPHPCLLVMDADALNLLASNPSLQQQLFLLNQQKSQTTVLTPHMGEAARLLSCTVKDVQLNRQQAIEKLVQKTGSVVVLKGKNTLIASPQHATVYCAQGNAGMGVSGMGDVLTGVIASLCAQGLRHQLPTWEATCLGVQLHATAADCLVKEGVGPIGLTPTEVIYQIRQLINHHTSE